MPIVRVELLAGRSPQIKQALAAEMTAVVGRHLGNDPAHVYVIFDDVAHHNWAVAGRVFDTPTPAPVKSAPEGKGP